LKRKDIRDGAELNECSFKPAVSIAEDGVEDVHDYERNPLAIKPKR
jgi:hypothetical protein